MKMGVILGTTQNSILIYAEKTVLDARYSCFSTNNYNQTNSEVPQLKLKLKLVSEMQNNYN